MFMQEVSDLFKKAVYMVTAFYFRPDVQDAIEQVKQTRPMWWPGSAPRSKTARSCKLARRPGPESLGLAPAGRPKPLGNRGSGSAPAP